MSVINYFSEKELSCRCGCGWNNFSETLLLIINTYRHNLKRPIVINSACRCYDHNANIGSKENSSHPKGLAVDISIKNSSERDEILREIYRYVAPSIHRIGISKDYIHIDIDPNKPQNVVWLY
jgi:uncharacterized protein YcbK (DUF882 family)